MPYIEEMVTIGKAENGYVLNVRVPYKDDDMDNCPCAPYEDRNKNILCTDMKDLLAKIEKLLPALTDRMSAEEEFDKAFGESTSQRSD